MSENDTPERDELDEIRKLGKKLGMPGEIRPEDHGITLESAEEFVARMQSGQPQRDSAVPTRLPNHRRNWRGLQIAAAAAAAASVVLVTIFTPWSQPSATANTPPILNYEFAKATNIAYAPGQPARQDLLHLAQAARTSNPPAQSGGSVQYVQTNNWFSSREDTKKSSTSKLIPTTIQAWLSPDGSQTSIESSGTPLRADGRGLAPSTPSTTATRDQVFPPHSADPHRISELGTTVNDVRRELLRSAECDPNATPTARAQCLYQEITGLFRQYVVGPKVASLFWTVLANEPGFRTLGSVTDRAGRPGVGISVISSEAPEFRLVLIIGRSTGQLLGTEEILIKSNAKLGLKAPAINAFTAILKSEYTPDRPGAR